MSEGPTRVMLVDPNEVVRAGMARVFGREGDVQITVVVATEEEALRVLPAAAPYVVLVTDRTATE